MNCGLSSGFEQHPHSEGNLQPQKPQNLEFFSTGSICCFVFFFIACNLGMSF